jgi:hypothetical protein
MNVLIAKTHTLEVAPDKFNSAVKDFIWNYGLRQILNDAGSSGKSPDEKLAMAEKKLTALYEGVLRKTREARDPVTNEALKIARKIVKATFGLPDKPEGFAQAEMLAFCGKHEIEVRDDDEDTYDLVVEFVADQPKVRAQAEEIVAAAKPKADLDSMIG